jgi:hypothetical protein
VYATINRAWITKKPKRPKIQNKQHGVLNDSQGR